MAEYKELNYKSIVEEVKLIKIYDNIDEYIINFNFNSNITITIETLLFILFDIYEYIPNNEKISNHIVRQYQNKFRRSIIQKYKKCIITGKDNFICEACHIVPFSDCNYTDKYNIYNGLLLSSELHILFDNYKMSIDENCKVVFSKDILENNNYKEYHNYHNKIIDLDKKTMENINIHYTKFMQNLCKIYKV